LVKTMKSEKSTGKSVKQKNPRKFGNRNPKTAFGGNHLR